MSAPPVVGVRVADVGAADLSPQPADGSTVRRRLRLSKGTSVASAQSRPGQRQMGQRTRCRSVSYDPNTARSSSGDAKIARKLVHGMLRETRKAQGARLDFRDRSGGRAAPVLRRQEQPNSEEVGGSSDPPARWSSGAKLDYFASPRSADRPFAQRSVIIYHYVSQSAIRLQEPFSKNCASRHDQRIEIDGCLSQLPGFTCGDVDFQVAKRTYGRVRGKASGKPSSQHHAGQQIITKVLDVLTAILGADLRHQSRKTVAH